MNLRTPERPSRPAGNPQTSRSAPPALGFFLALACLALLGMGFPGEAQALDPVGSLTRVQGKVSAMSGGDERAMSPGDPVHLGETLITGEQARAELTMRDATVITLSEQTVFTIERFDQARHSARFEMVRGAFRAATGSIAKPSKPDFTVKTPLAVIGIRGTDFWGGFLTPEELSVFMISGRGVFVKNASGRQDITKPGQGITVLSPDQPPSPAVMWGQPKVDRAFKTVTFE